MADSSTTISMATNLHFSAKKRLRSLGLARIYSCRLHYHLYTSQPHVYIFCLVTKIPFLPTSTFTHITSKTFVCPWLYSPAGVRCSSSRILLPWISRIIHIWLVHSYLSSAASLRQQPSHFFFFNLFLFWGNNARYNVRLWGF